MNFCEKFGQRLVNGLCPDFGIERCKSCIQYKLKEAII